MQYYKIEDTHKKFASKKGKNLSGGTINANKSGSCTNTDRPQRTSVQLLVVGANFCFNQDPGGIGRRNPPLSSIGFLLTGTPDHHFWGGRLREPANLRRGRQTCSAIGRGRTMGRSGCRGLGARGISRSRRIMRARTKGH